MILYSEVLSVLQPRLKELGFEGDSVILRETGDSVFTSTSMEALLPKVLEWEVKIRSLVKAQEEATRRLEMVNNEQQQKAAIKQRLVNQVSELFPQSQMREEFAHIHPGFIHGVISELEKKASFCLDENNQVVIAGRSTTNATESMTELEKILHEAKISHFPLHQETVKELIYNSVDKAATEILFKE